MKIECEREQDVLDAFAAQRWPARCHGELVAHVRGCSICTDLAEVANALLDDHDTLPIDDDRLAAAGVVWWRAQLRAREEDARAAVRPIAFIQGVAASVAVWLVVALLRTIPIRWLGASRAWAADLIADVRVPVPDLTRVTAGVPAGLLFVMAAAVLLVPLAIYFAVADD